MKIYIDTETFHAAPALYADAEKTKRLPATIPVVEGWAQELSIGFLGANQPAESATVRLVLAPQGGAVEVARSTDGVRSTDAAGNALYAVLLSIDTSAMRALLDAARAKTLPLVAGVLVTDADAGTRVEYQFRVSVSESVIGVWETPVSMSELNLALGETRAARDAAQRAQGGAETAQSAAEAAQVASEAARDAAKASETASKASEGAASESAESAAASARDADESASLAGSRANAAEASAESASRSAQEAGASAANALQSERSASASAETAESAAADADASANAASESAAAAQGSASAAATSATEASESAEAAQASEAAAGTSAENAAASATESSQSATESASSASAAKASEASAAESAATASAKAEEISASAETIASNSSRLDALEGRVAENETALTTKADAADLTDETQRATAKENELETAIGAKADAAKTYTKSEIDGVDTGAEIMKRLAEDEKYLREYEEFAGIKLPPEFWEAYFGAVKEWQKDPTLKVWGEEEKEKYKGKPIIKPLIDLSVTYTKMFLEENKEFRASAVYFPNLTIGESLLRSSENMSGHVIAPNVESAKWILNGVGGVKYAYFPNINYGLSFAIGSGVEKAYVPNITTATYAFYMCRKYNHYTKINNAKNCDYLIEGGSSFNNVFEMGSCSTAKNAFKNTRLDSSNIAKILNSLPAWADGKSHVITFTGSPGIASTASEETFGGVENCPTFDNDDEAHTLRTAYASAIMRGWTVEI